MYHFSGCLVPIAKAYFKSSDNTDIRYFDPIFCYQLDSFPMRILFNEILLYQKLINDGIDFICLIGGKV